MGQNQFEEVLRAKVAEFGVHVELGMELTSFNQDQDGVTAHVRHHQDDTVSEMDIRASYLIGTDGAKGEQEAFPLIISGSDFSLGVTRKLLKLTFSGETRDAEGFVVGDVEISGLDTDVCFHIKP